MVSNGPTTDDRPAQRQAAADGAVDVDGAGQARIDDAKCCLHQGTMEADGDETHVFALHHDEALNTWSALLTASANLAHT